MVEFWSLFIKRKDCVKELILLITFLCSTFRDFANTLIFIRTTL